ncbi:EXLDI protein [Monashia sp. NPDC004114]
MPNKTIYVSEADLPLFERAQELVGGNLSQAITKGLRRLVELEEGKLEGFEEITVHVGTGKGRRQRFLGILLVEWGRTRKGGVYEQFRVYRTRTGKIALHHQKSEEFIHQGGADGQATGWRKHFSSDQVWGTTPATATLEVFDTIAQLKGEIPTELFDLVAAAAEQPLVEDLDI